MPATAFVYALLLSDSNKACTKANSQNNPYVNTLYGSLTTIIPREVIILAGSWRVGFTGLGEAPWLTLHAYRKHSL